MLNIKYKGIFRTENQLGKKQINTEVTCMDTTNSTPKVLLFGLNVIIPAVISMFSLVHYYLRTSLLFDYYPLEQTIINWLILMALLLLSIPIHELIHAICFPIRDYKEVYFMPSQLLFFVYCNANVSKIRFIIINLLPNLLLGFIPFFIGQIIYNAAHTGIGMLFQLFGVCNIVAGLGDYYNTYLAINNVPKDAILFNSGIKTYYYVKTNKAHINKNKKDLIFLTIAFFSLGMGLININKMLGINILLINIIIASFIDDKFEKIFRWIITILLVLLLFEYI